MTRLFFLFSSLLICFCESTLAQSIPNPAGDSLAVTQDQPMKYVKIEVGMHILDCPILPPQLKAKLMSLKGIRDYAVNLKDETILFAIPDGVATKEQIVNMAVKSGFPITAVNVIMDSKPFTN